MKQRRADSPLSSQLEERKGPARTSVQLLIFTGAKCIMADR